MWTNAREGKGPLKGSLPVWYTWRKTGNIEKRQGNNGQQWREGEMSGAESEGDEGYTHAIIIINISIKKRTYFTKIVGSLITTYYDGTCQSQSSCGLRRGSAAARLLGLRVRIPPWERTCVFWGCCVLSGLRVGLTAHQENTYRVVCINESDYDNEGAPTH